MVSRRVNTTLGQPGVGSTVGMPARVVDPVTNYRAKGSNMPAPKKKKNSRKRGY